MLPYIPQLVQALRHDTVSLLLLSLQSWNMSKRICFEFRPNRRWAMWLNLSNTFRNVLKLLPISSFGTCKPTCTWMKINSTKTVSLKKITVVYPHQMFQISFHLIFSCIVWSFGGLVSEHNILLLWRSKTFLWTWIRVFWKDNGRFRGNSIISKGCTA